MIVDTLTLRGIGPFKADVALDFHDLPAGAIVAIVGDNGQGKTTLLECMGPAPLYREFPSYRDPKGGRGEPLASHVRPDVRDAMLEVAYRVSGRPVTVHVDVDGKRNKTEAYVTADGQTHGPLLKEVDQAIATLFPSRALFLAGPFACQGGFDGFFRLGPSDRKELFAELLGLGHLQALAEAADERAKATVGTLERVRERLRDCEPAIARLSQVKEALVGATSALSSAQIARDAAAAAHVEAIAAHAGARDALAKERAQAERVTGERRRLEAAERDVAASVDQLAMRRRGLNALLAEATEIRAAAAALPGLDAELAQARETERTAAARLPELEAAVATATAERERLLKEYNRLLAEQTTIQAAGARVAEIADLEARRAQHQADLTVAADAIATYDAGMTGLVEAADAEAAAIARRNILVTRRDVLQQRQGFIGKGLPECATCPAVSDAQEAVRSIGEIEAEMAELPLVDGAPAADRVRVARIARQNADDARAHAQRQLTAAVDALTARAADREKAARGQAVDAELEATLTSGKAAKATLDDATATRDGCRRDVELATAAVRHLEEQRAPLAVTAARVAEISTAEGQQAELVTQEEDAERRRQALRDELAALPVYDIAAAETYVRTLAAAEVQACTAVEAQAAAVRVAERDVARLEGERDAIGDPGATRAAAAAEEATLVTEVADWSVLGRALGSKGVQALLIDAAGPEVSALANDLLATCYTPRFQIALTTTQPTADGKGVREVFDARILDAEAGRDGTRGSGGETALIDAALRLATVIVNARRSTVPTETLFLDEATAALSPTNAPAYVSMIRRAMQLGSFNRCFLISHQQEVWESADVRLIVEDGQARIVGAPLAAAA